MLKKEAKSASMEHGEFTVTASAVNMEHGEFTATASAINSGLKKLAKVTPLTQDRRLYRGISNMFFDNELLKGDAKGDCIFVETGFSSATPDLFVALGYACDSSGNSTLLEIDTGGIDRGAGTPFSKVSRVKV